MQQVKVRARNTDPETSHQAAFAFESDQGKVRRSVACVVLILKTHGPLNDFALGELWGQYWGSNVWSHSLPAKARHWAREAGLVKHEGFGDHNGRRVRLWALGADVGFQLHPRCPTCGHKLAKKMGGKA